MRKHIAKWASITLALLSGLAGPFPHSAQATTPGSGAATIDGSASDSRKWTAFDQAVRNRPGMEPKRGGETTGGVLGERCTSEVPGRQLCLRPSASPAPKMGTGDVAPNDVIPFPDYCFRGGWWGTREAACGTTSWTLVTLEYVNGQYRETGLMYVDVVLFQYGDVDFERFIFQIGLRVRSSYGHTDPATVGGTALGDPDRPSCRRESGTMQERPFLPAGTMHAGEGRYIWDFPVVGAVLQCRVAWQMTVRVPGYGTSSPAWYVNQLRCDHAAGAFGNYERPGCVWPRYISRVDYSRAHMPTLVAHVEQAQASGLPGKFDPWPLVRTTNEAIIRVNRAGACGDAPSIERKSCDEYPLASTKQGLWAGGIRRTFAGCNINAGTDSGPLGVSACMVNEEDNSRQGAVMAAFYHDWRVLNDDPYVVAIVP